MSLLFPIGLMVATPTALAAFARNGQTPLPFLQRHQSGDWGDLDKDDREANNAALKNGSRILSAYYLNDREKIWIITEADRSSTCVLLPEDY